jgi:hypothetical protein
MPFDLARFDLAAQLRCSREVRKEIAAAVTLEDAARRTSRYFYEELRAPDGAQRACPLVRCYKTHSFSELPAELQLAARRALGAEKPPPGMRCLTLLGSAGDEPAWNSRFRSKAHRAIPLPSVSIVEQAPMVAQLIREFGLDLAAVVQPAPELVRETKGRKYGVFHVAEARGSPHIPAQAEFVEKYGVRSVVGFGGTLATEDLFAVILFSRVPIAAAAAERFRAIALDVKGGFFAFGPQQVFEVVRPAPKPEIEHRSVRP